MSLILQCECPGRFIFHDKTGPVCSKCGGTAVEGPPPARIFRQLDVDYECPVTGKPIRSKHAHEENLRIHDCHILEKGEREDRERNKLYHDKKLDAELDKSVEQLLGSLPDSAVDALAKDITSSEVTFERK